MRTVVSPSTQPSDVVAVNQTDITENGKLYGVEHKNFDENGKRFKVHVRPTDNKVELIGFRNCTGHLNEAQAFATLQDVFNYCQEKNHTLLEFDDRDDFAAWLLS